MTDADARALVRYINETDARFSATLLSVPTGGDGGQVHYVILADRNTGGNPPLVCGMEDYREHLAAHRYPVAAGCAFDQWVRGRRRPGGGADASPEGRSGTAARALFYRHSAVL